MECPACGTHVDAGALDCPGCGATLSIAGTPDSFDAGPPPPAAPPPPPPPQARPGAPPPWQPPRVDCVPFEDPSRPFLERLIATVKASFATPVALFSAIGEGSLGAPLVYALVIGTIANVIGGIWSLLINTLGLMADSSSPQEKAVVAAVSGAMILGAPLFVLLGLFVQAGIYHVALMLLGGARRDFSVTFRVVAYAIGPGLLAIVPLCGGLAGGIWVMVLTILGATYAHRTDGWRAAIAYFLPVLACCCLALGLIALIATMVAGAQGGAELPELLTVDGATPSGPAPLRLGLLYGVVLVTSGAMALAWLRLGLPAPRCPLLAFTGIPCVTCGATRMVAALGEGRLWDGFLLNPLLFLAGAGLAAWAVLDLVALLRRRPPVRLPGSLLRGWPFRITALALVVLNWGWVILCER